jgi:outer membrane protein
MIGINQEKMLKQKRQWWRSLIIVFCIATLSITGFFLSAHASDLKIGIVDTEKILRESVPAVKAQKKIEQEFLPRDEEIKLMTQQAKTMQEKLENDSITLDDAKRRDLERELANLSREYQRAHRQMREDLSVRQNEEYGVILKRANRAIRNVAETEQYDLILQKQDTVYRSQRVDITEQVIQALEKEQ